MSEELIAQLKTDPRFQGVSDEELGRVARIAARLRSISLLESLSDLDRAYIAQAGKLQESERGDILIHQGDTERVLYIILKGQLRVWTRDERGHKRLLNYHGANDFCGELVFISGHERAANVDVVDDATLVAFEEEGWERICAHRQIRDYLYRWGPERVRQSNRPFQGKHWDEVTVVRARKSWLALARRIVIPILIILLAVAITGLLSIFVNLLREVTTSVILAIVVGMVLWIAWMWEDWRNDDYIVTSKRIIHIERVLIPPFPHERHEAAIEMIQEIATTTQGLWTTLFKVHTLDIRTQGAGTIRFPDLDDADRIREQIFKARDQARVRKIGEEQTRIREKLFRQLGRPVKEVIPLDTGETVQYYEPPKGLLKMLDYFVPHTCIVLPDQIRWRQHWLILLTKLIPVFVLFVAAGALLALGIVWPPFFGSTPGSRWLLLVPGGLLLLVSIVLYLWRYDGWRNHVYILTDTRIVDIEGTPFHFRGETRVEGTFDSIQNITYDSPNFFYRALRIGNVDIDTAAEQRAYTFDLVGRPDEVQQEIFRRLVRYRERQELGETERRYDEFAKWFEAYHHSVIEKQE
jgi:CRP-like cAMP-binding protein